MVTSKKLFICEGNDDKAFLNKFVKEYMKFQSNKFEIEKMNSKSDIFKIEKYNSISVKVDVGQYDKVLFFFDSDFLKNDHIFGGYENSETQIKNIITNLKFDDVADYFICCDPSTKNGNLEHLLLAAAEHDKKDCINKFIHCIQGMDTTSNKKIVLTAYKEIFKEYPYNFEHPCFTKLKEKITWLFG